MASGHDGMMHVPRLFWGFWFSSHALLGMLHDCVIELSTCAL
jgi:hypothetical protein